VCFVRGRVLSYTLIRMVITGGFERGRGLTGVGFVLHSCRMTVQKSQSMVSEQYIGNYFEKRVDWWTSKSENNR